jgi:hypothetical protein
LEFVLKKTWKHGANVLNAACILKLPDARRIKDRKWAGKTGGRFTIPIFHGLGVAFFARWSQWNCFLRVFIETSVDHGFHRLFLLPCPWPMWRTDETERAESSFASDDTPTSLIRTVAHFLEKVTAVSN